MVECYFDFADERDHAGTISMSEQVEYNGFEESEFAENPEPRVPCVLLLDVSGSMGGRPITELNEGLVTLKDTLSADSLASKRAEIAIVTFGGTVDVIQDFVTAEHFQPPRLKASGGTPMGQAIVTGLDLIALAEEDLPRQRRRLLPTLGFPNHRRRTRRRGEAAADLVKQGEASKSLVFFTVGVEGANSMSSLRSPHGADEAEGAELPRPLPLALAIHAVGVPVVARRQSVAAARRMGRDLRGRRHVEARLWWRRALPTSDPGCPVRTTAPLASSVRSWSPPAPTGPEAPNSRSWGHASRSSVSCMKRRNR